MKVGDLVKVKKGAGVWTTSLVRIRYPGRVGIITEVRKKRNEVFILIGNKSVSFLPQYLEVISESR
jgi:ribosomal protein L21E